ncbi:stage II sporulation protein R [Lysinibacillus telephonicus]|uniref:Stage II sporulation protein R n=2 Tax=Lysinibacillus telephonicus TaxID=1714840 RepID=A0A3S0KG74_9BACI|nr:stage II sporulation protein R [Lysinibacillus telephonicus]
MMSGREFIMLNDYEITRVEKTVYPILSLLKLIACSLAVFCAILLLPKFINEVYETRNNLVDDSLKIRVIANSNTAADQQLKSEMVASLTPYFKQIQENEISNAGNEEIYEQLAAFVEKNYAQADVKINIGENLIPPKIAANTFYPQYFYNSIVLTIGDGRGDNWWCSIFPNVCERPSEKEDTKKSEEAEEKEVKFLVWEWIKKLFN